jgi:predicted nucleic acid-binding protein
MPRVVLDTNVILSGLIRPAGVPGQIGLREVTARDFRD